MRPTAFVRILIKPRAQQNAINSPLLRLPPEIRKKIWTFAVQVDRVRVSKESCWHMRHMGQPHVTNGGAVAVEDDGAIALSQHLGSAYQCCPSRQLAAFHLPEVCRQIYIETAMLSYSSNIFLVGEESLMCKNWAKGEILLAQRDAITRVELGLNILNTQLWKNHRPTYSLKQRSFRNLTHIHVSFHTQKLLVKDSIHWMLDHDETDISKLLTWCETKLKDIEGSDLMVVFEEDNTPGIDSYATLSDIFSHGRDLIDTDSDTTDTDDEITDTEEEED
jgi:hypothetical protein